jgi:hypothetical protein
MVTHVDQNWVTSLIEPTLQRESVAKRKWKCQGLQNTLYTSETLKCKSCITKGMLLTLQGPVVLYASPALTH